MQFERGERLALQVVVAQHQCGDFIGELREHLVAVAATEPTTRLDAIGEDLEVDLDVRGVHTGRVVDEVGVDASACERVLHATALRETEIAAFAHHACAKIVTIHAQRIVAAIACGGLRLEGGLDVSANAAVPQQVDPHAQDGADQLRGGQRVGVEIEEYTGLCREAHRFRAAIIDRTAP